MRRQRQRCCQPERFSRREDEQAGKGRKQRKVERVREVQRQMGVWQCRRCATLALNVRRQGRAGRRGREGSDVPLQADGASGGDAWVRAAGPETVLSSRS